MAAEWGLTWSRRWHRVNPDGPVSRGGMPTALCGDSTFLYTHSNILIRTPRHIKAIFDFPGLAPVCKHCDKKGRGHGDPTSPY